MCLAVPGKVVEVLESDDPLLRAGRVSFGGSIREVSLAYVPEARVGDYVTVHVGFALAVVDEADARLVFDFLELQEGGAASAEQAP